MRTILAGRLWIGNVADADDLSGVFAAGIEALVDLAVNETPRQPAHSLIYVRFPLVDGSDNDAGLLRLAVGAVESLIAAQVPTLVFCSSGMSRSIGVTAMALAKIREQEPDETLTEIARELPHDLAPVLWRDLCLACA